MPAPKAIFAALVFLIAGFLITGCRNPSHLPDEVSFNRHIRPILSDNCFQCHGPDEETREGELRLDQEEEAKAPRDGYRVIYPGKPHKSELIRRIKLDPSDEDRMPHEDANKTLTPEQIELLERWIDQGAAWQKHWAFIEPARPDLPQSMRDASPSQTIDHLLTAELDRQNLQASTRASEQRLIRRLAYTLTGLPPNVDQPAAFMVDDNSGVYANVVDQYLASSQYGERWARHWMDVIRYCESAGHEDDNLIGGAWQYRDYLIRAFNQDLPYDQLVLEHLAGDLLSSPRLHPTEKFNESVIGPAFLALGEAKSFPLSLKQEETERIHAMIDVVSTAFQSMSVACARCHDHKFDPIPTADYYAMYGMFESMRIGPRPARFGEEKRKTLDEIRTLKRELEGWIASKSKETPVRPASAVSTVSEGHRAPADSSFVVIGDFRDGFWDGWSADGPAFGDAPVTSGVLYDRKARVFERVNRGRASSRYFAPGISGALRSPNFVITHDSLLFRARASRGTMRVIIENYQPINDLLYGALDDFWVDAGWDEYAINVSTWKGWIAYIEFMPGRYSMQTLNLDPDDYIDVEYAVAFSGDRPDMERQGTGASSEGGAVAGEVGPDYISRFDSLTVAVHDTTHFIGVTAGDPLQSPVFIRGDFNQESENTVPHGFLSAIETIPDSFAGAEPSRLAWAKAVVDPKNPLTARIMVNRIWHYMFGRGLVETVDDFGAQGKPPSHPELLDYLALQFIQDDWSVKKMIRHIALTEAFQRSSQADSSAARRDPQNIYLHHYPVRRLEAEAIRDGTLAVSGRLDSTMYGEPVRMNYDAFKTARSNVPESGPLDGAGRRSIYQEVRRNYFTPMMLIFDMPQPSNTVGRRNVSYTPAQALSMLNDPFFHEQAGVWAQNLIEKNSEASLEERVNQMHRIAFSRDATSDEISRARQFLEKQAIEYGRTLEEMTNDEKLWADYAHVLFNLKEFIHLL